MKPRLLVADDFEAVRVSLKDFLSPHFQVDTASSADEAIEMARKNSYALIITDNDMKDGHGDSGLYLIEQIRKVDRSTPIFLYTGTLTEALRERALALGANEVLDKTLQLVAELTAKLKAYYGKDEERAPSSDSGRKRTRSKLRG